MAKSAAHEARTKWSEETEELVRLNLKELSETEQEMLDSTFTGRMTMRAKMQALAVIARQTQLKYEPEISAQKVVEFIDNGGTPLEANIALHLGVSVRSVHLWKYRYPDFAEAMAYAKTKAQAQYEEAHLNGATGQKTVNATLITGYLSHQKELEDFRPEPAKVEVEHTANGLTDWLASIQPGGSVSLAGDGPGERTISLSGGDDAD